MHSFNVCVCSFHVILPVGNFKSINVSLDEYKPCANPTSFAVFNIEESEYFLKLWAKENYDVEFNGSDRGPPVVTA